MMAVLRNNIGNHIPVLADDILRPVIMTNYNFSIFGITTGGYEGAAISRRFIIATAGFSQVIHEGHIIKSQFFNGVVGCYIEAIIILFLCLQSCNNTIDLIFILPFQFGPQEISCGAAVKLPVSFSVVLQQPGYRLDAGIYIA